MIDWTIRLVVLGAALLPPTAPVAAQRAESAAPTAAVNAEHAEAAPATGHHRTVAIIALGHASFEIVSAGGTRLLIDPFLTDNPVTPPELKRLDRYRPHAILVSHADPEHAADVVPIARLSQAKVIGARDHLANLPLPERLRAGGNVGGKIKVGDTTVHLVPAMHGSSAGQALGFVIRFDDRRSIYYSGDTTIFGDMALIQRLHHPTVVLMQAGGGLDHPDPQLAAFAVRRFFRPRLVIPMHYGSYPVLATADEVRRAFRPLGNRLRMLEPGEKLTF